MHITIYRPSGISERGHRMNNEDSVYPLPERVSASQRLFMVCDGVGGNEKGEVASALACESIHIYFDTFLKPGEEPDAEFIRKAVQYTEACFDTYIKEHPEAKGMATTLTLAYITSFGIIMAHIGDSRIYYMREGEILHQTEDHSLVNSLVKLGRITPEEARTHPSRNVIMRAIQGTKEPAEPEVIVWNDVQAGDHLFLCTDGVLEAMDNERISEIFRCNYNLETIKGLIMEACQMRSRDNYSFYIVRIRKVQDHVNLKQNLLLFLHSFI